MRKSLGRLALIATALTFSVASSGTAVSAEFEWKMTAAWPGGPYLDRDAKMFVDRVRQLTDGRVDISLYPGGTLYSPLKVTEGVRSGIAEAGHSWAGYDWGIDKASIMFGGYPGGITPEGFMLWLYKGGGLELWREFREEEFGVIAFPCSMNGTEIFMHSHKRVETLEDLEGLKLRTAGAWAEIAGRMGASTVILPGGEVYEALERGTIDATEWGSPEINQALGFHELAKYIVTPGLHQPGGPNECVFNKEAWDQLSERDQEMIELAAKETVFETWLTSTAADLEAFEQLSSGENEMVQVNQEFVDEVKAQSQKWLEELAAENDWARRVIDSQNDFKDKLASWPKFRFPIGSLAQ